MIDILNPDQKKILTAIGGKILEQLQVQNVDQLPDRDRLFMYLGMAIAYQGVLEKTAPDLDLKEHITNLALHCNEICDWIKPMSLADILAQTVNRN